MRKIFILIKFFKIFLGYVFYGKMWKCYINYYYVVVWFKNKEEIYG